MKVNAIRQLRKYPSASLFAAIVFILIGSRAVAQKNLVIETALTAISPLHREIPGYVDVHHGLYRLYSSGRSVEHTFSYGGEVTGLYEKFFRTNLSGSAGFGIGYRQLNLVFSNAGYFIQDPDNTKPVIFRVDIRRELLMVHVPVCVTYHVNQNFSAEASMRTNFVVTVIRKDVANPAYFDYRLDQLNRRPTRTVLPEASLGVNYRLDALTVKLRYAIGLRTMQTKIANTYNELIIEDIYLSSISLVASIKIKSLSD